MTKLQILGPLYSVLSVDIVSFVSVSSGEMMKNDRPGFVMHGTRQDAGKFGRTKRPSDTEPMRPVFRA